MQIRTVAAAVVLAAGLGLTVASWAQRPMAPAVSRDTVVVYKSPT
ncbi:MAG: hypothetical protein AB7H88_22035 [Vicinamibacterales bacterium]